MFYHKECGAEVKVLLDNIKVVGFPQLGREKLRISHVILQPVQQKTIDVRTEFFCSVCNTSVELDETVVECSRCYEHNEIENLYIFEGFPGIFCEGHANMVEKDLGKEYKRKKLSTKVQTIQIKGEK